MIKNFEKINSIFKVFTAVGFVLTIITAVFSVLHFHPDYDTQFLYQWSNELLKGKTLYSDIAMLQTPLSAYFTSLFLLLHNSILSVHISIAVLVFILGFVLFLVSRELKIPPYLSLFCIFVWMCFNLADSFTVCNTYDYLSISLYFLSFYFLLKHKRTNKQINIIMTGISAALCFFAKQTFGFYCVAFLGVYLISYWVKYKINFKTVLKEFLFISVPYILTFGAFILGFALRRNLKDFLDCCVFGVSSFNNDLGGIKVLLSLSVLLIVFAGLPVTFKISAPLVVFLIGPMLGLYPLMDVQRILCFSCGYVIITALILTKFLFPGKNNKKDSSRVLNIVFIFIISTVVLFSCVLIPVRQLKAPFYSDTKTAVKDYLCSLDVDVAAKIPNPYKSLFDFIDSSENTENIHWMTSEAGFLDIYTDRYDGQYDLFLKGNFGSESPMDFFLANADKNDLFVLPSSDITGWTGVASLYPKEVLEYIRENYKQVDSITNKYGITEWNIYMMP